MGKHYVLKYGAVSIACADQVSAWLDDSYISLSDVGLCRWRVLIRSWLEKYTSSLCYPLAFLCADQVTACKVSVTLSAPSPALALGALSAELSANSGLALGELWAELSAKFRLALGDSRRLSAALGGSRRSCLCFRYS